MKESITPGQIRQTNRLLIYHLIYNQKKMSQQDISYELRLSRPTVASQLAELEKSGLIRREGVMNSDQVGRKAAAYSVVADYRIAIGISLSKKHVRIVALNLYGEVIDQRDREMDYFHADFYYHEVCQMIHTLFADLHIARKQVLGIGIALPSHISPDGQKVVYGRLLSNTGLTVQAFSQYLNYPITLLYDANCAAVSELWKAPELENAFCLQLSGHLSAAVISNRMVLSGKHGHSSSIEHLQIKPGGKECYCGRRGCMETFCSLSSLLEENETLDSFFDLLRRKDEAVCGRWSAYLHELARAIHHLHLVYDMDFILGGELAPYIREEDLTSLYEEISQMTLFPVDRDYLSLGRMHQNGIPIGAALPYIWSFLGDSSL